MFTAKEYSVTLNHGNATTSHVFEYIESLEIFVNITESESWIPFWGLDSFSDLETEINQVFGKYGDILFPRWETTLEAWRDDYLSAWSDFVCELERDELEDEMGEEYYSRREEDYHEYLVSSAGF
jgi:hypothetical protein